LKLAVIGKALHVKTKEGSAKINRVAGSIIVELLCKLLTEMI
jgi:hypothetical protein